MNNIKATADTESILADYLPFWKSLGETQRAALVSASQKKTYPKGVILHSGSDDCIGLLLIVTGQLRAYYLSDEGRELTLYRLLDRDMCLFSASCMINEIQFDVMVSTEKETELILISPVVYKRLMEESAAVANYTNQLMASHFSEVVWLIDQIQNKKLDSRLASLLLDERALRGCDELDITHEQLGNHLGSMREVITRMLKYFQGEGLVSLSRGSITLTDIPGLEKAARANG